MLNTRLWTGKRLVASDDPTFEWIYAFVPVHVIATFVFVDEGRWTYGTFENDHRWLLGLFFQHRLLRYLHDRHFRQQLLHFSQRWRLRLRYPHTRFLFCRFQLDRFQNLRLSLLILLDKCRQAALLELIEQVEHLHAGGAARDRVGLLLEVELCHQHELDLFVKLWIFGADAVGQFAEAEQTALDLQWIWGGHLELGTGFELYRFFLDVHEIRGW